MQLQTERLILEPLEIAHAEKLYAGLSDATLYKFIPNDRLSLAELTEKYHRILRGPRDNNIELWRNWAVRLQDSSDYIGMIETSIFPSDYAYLAYFNSHRTIIKAMRMKRAQQCSSMSVRLTTSNASSPKWMCAT